MSKIARITHRIFGSNADTNQLGKFGSLQATGTGVTTTDPAIAMSLSNWLTGWFGAIIGGNAAAIEDENAVDFVHSYQLGYLFQTGVPEWDAGTVYYSGSLCSVAGVIYVSKTDGNTGHAVTDTANWKPYSTTPTGVGMDFTGSTLPAGYVWASGKTIGDAGSGATERADADTQDLYNLFWASYDDSTLPIYTSGGVLTTRGGSAAADWAAKKAIAVIDKRGRVSVGKDNLGGTNAGRLSTMGGNTTLGGAGGEQQHTLSSGEMPNHAHTLHDNGHAHNISGIGASPGGVAGGSGAAWMAGNIGTDGATTGIYMDATGGGAAHNNIQPTLVLNYIIKL